MKWRPLLTPAAIRQAYAEGLAVEYTSNRTDTYEMPASNAPFSGGWVSVSADFAASIPDARLIEQPGDMWRALEAE